MELFDMLLKGFGGSQNQQQDYQNQQNYELQQDELRRQQQYRDLQRDMPGSYGSYDNDDQVFDGDLNELSRKLNIPPDKVQSVIKMALPLILGKMGQNVESEEGARSLAGALERHQGRRYHSPEEIDEEDGRGILGNIFGGNSTERVSEEIGRTAGVDKNSSMKILTMLAPLALAYLARKKQTQKLDERGVRDLTRRYSDEMNDRAGGTLYDALRDLPDQNQNQDQQSSGGLLGNILGGLLGR